MSATSQPICLCPDDCNCHHPWRTNYCGCKAHDADETTYEDVWQFTENAPTYASATADLWYWSTNYDAGKGPITLFLDLIGWSDENIGEPLFSLKDASLGYLELGKLAAALNEYADRPTDVREWVDQLLTFDES